MWEEVIRNEDGKIVGVLAWKPLVRTPSMLGSP
jgi:hypothetical protein